MLGGVQSHCKKNTLDDWPRPGESSATASMTQEVVQKRCPVTAEISGGAARVASVVVGVSPGLLVLISTGAAA